MARAMATTDHALIKSWVEKRGGYPAAVRGAKARSRNTVTNASGLLRIDFEPRDEQLERIEWDQFFKAFDGNELAFLFQDKTADGKLSRFNKFVSRDSVDEEELQASGKKAPSKSQERDEDEDDEDLEAADEDEDFEDEEDDEDWDDEDEDLDDEDFEDEDEDEDRR